MSLEGQWDAHFFCAKVALEGPEVELRESVCLMCWTPWIQALALQKSGVLLDTSNLSTQEGQDFRQLSPI